MINQRGEKTLIEKHQEELSSICKSGILKLNSGVVRLGSYCLASWIVLQLISGNHYYH